MTRTKTVFSRLERRFFRLELAKEIHKRARDIPFLGILTASFIAFLFHPFVGALKAGIWVTTFILIYLSAYWFLFRNRCIPSHKTYSAWTFKFVAFFGSFALMWATFAYMAMPELGEWQRLSLLMILFGIVALPAPVFSLCLPIAVFHPTTMLLPSILMCVLQHVHFDLHMLASLILLGGGVVFVCKQVATGQRILRSVDDKRALSSSMSTIEKLISEKYIDPVTGLLNGDGLQEQLPNMASSPLTVLAIKVDGIEDMYSLHGKGIADSIVWSIAHRLMSRKKPMAFLAHTGLGEFILVTPGAKCKDLRSKAKPIFELFSTPFVTDLGDVSFKVSIGAAFCEKKGGAATQAVSDAVAAMRTACWEQGNSFQQYDESLGTKLSQQFSIRSQLHKAIENNEFALHLQPKVDLSSGLVNSAEALIRWNSPELGMVSPAEFIPVAESTGDIIPLGRWVLQEAARLVQNPKLPASFSIAVNLSSKQFSDPALLSQLKQIHKRLKGTSRSLELEITESMVMAESADINRMLTKIKAMGFKIALDDFGTGYSSLSYLSRLQADTLKLDKSFIDPIPNDQQHADFVASIILMVKALKLKLVAEGIESEEQFDWFAAQGCDEAQGFFLARPVDFEAFLASLPLGRAQVDIPKPA
ncbi:putative bifunctional diguanylate cyclase/phosphodiesterase [Marinobacter sediminum]|uniref:putative bifunctional diguanylate cyclase/phosphodiesterase n=1 Tax=Marinobacter sediminum TaxID=256323 RepID=UPI0035688BFC